MAVLKEIKAANVLVSFGRACPNSRWVVLPSWFRRTSGEKCSVPQVGHLEAACEYRTVAFSGCSQHIISGSLMMRSMGCNAPAAR
jgi:hypothetical protein